MKKKNNNNYDDGRYFPLDPDIDLAEQFEAWVHDFLASDEGRAMFPDPADGDAA